VLLTIIAVLACVVPARRAARMNPLETIRAD
jgi:ABC-type lipoprotein release transport system permease subunit